VDEDPSTLLGMTFIPLFMNEKETLENFRKRLIFRSWHRGTKEMDLLMGSFADQNVPGFSEDELRQYEDVLMNNDPDLYNWISGREEPPAIIESCPVFQRVKSHKYT